MLLPVPPSGESRELLQAIWAFAVANHKWPTFAQLDSGWDSGHDTDVADVLRDLPEGFVYGFDRRIPAQDSTVISLTVAGVAACPDTLARETLEIFLDFLRVATSIQKGWQPPADNPDARPSLTDADYVREATVVPAAGRRDLLQLLFLLLHNETSAWSGLAGPDAEGHWRVTLDRRIRAFRGVTDLNEYWTRRHKPWESRSDPTTPAPREATRDDEARLAVLSANPEVLADALLQSIYTAASGSITQIVLSAQLQPDISLATVEEGLRRLESQGRIQLHWLDPAPALPRVMLTAAGATRAEQSRERWANRIFRDRAARNALLAWIHDQGETPQGSVLITNFLRDPRSAVDGNFFSPGDLDAAAAYLCERGLIRGMAFVDQQHGPIRGRLTAEGIDCAEQGANVAEYFNSTPKFLSPSPQGNPQANVGSATTRAVNRKAVMVIYGHDGEANTALFDWLRAIGLQPQEWNQLVRASGKASPYIGDVLDEAFQNAQAVIAYFTPDEHVLARNAPPEDHASWRFQARPNVLIEAGMALVTHPARTVLAVLGHQDLPSDLAGRHYVRLSHTETEPLQDLAGRLQAAGCETDLTGRDWLRPTRFPARTNLPLMPALPRLPRDVKIPGQGNW